MFETIYIWFSLGKILDIVDSVYPQTKKYGKWEVEQLFI